MEELKGKALFSAKWTMIASIFTAINAPVYKIIIGMLLSTGDFAYLSVIALLNTLAALIGDIGIGKSLIKRKNVQNEEFTTALFIKFILSLVIGVIIFLSSGWIESFYGYEGLARLVKLSIITIVISSINNICSNMLQKELLFKNYSLITMISNVSDMVFSIMFILLNFGVVGFVYGTIIGVSVSCILMVSTIIRKTKFRIVMRFKIHDVRDFFEFGIVVSIKDILTYGVGKLDEIVIGKLLGQEMLGIYYFGKDFVKKPQDLLSKSITQSLFPILVQIKNDKKKLKEWYLKITKYMSLIAFPVFTGLAVTSNYFIKILYDGKWDSAIPIIQVFSFAALFTILTANIATSTLYSLDKHVNVLRVDIICNILYFIVLLFTNNKSLYLIMGVYVAYTIIKAIWLQNIVGKSLSYGWGTYLKTIKNFALGSLIMYVSISILNLFLDSVISSMLIIFLVDLVFGVIIYIAINILLDKNSVKDVKNLVLAGKKRRSK